MDWKDFFKAYFTAAKELRGTKLLIALLLPLAAGIVIALAVGVTLTAEYVFILALIVVIGIVLIVSIFAIGSIIQDKKPKKSQTRLTVIVYDEGSSSRLIPAAKVTLYKPDVAVAHTNDRGTALFEGEFKAKQVTICVTKDGYREFENVFSPQGENPVEKIALTPVNKDIPNKDGEKPKPPVQTDPKSLRTNYLSFLFESTSRLSLAGIDRKAAREGEPQISLNAVYTALMTLSTEQEKGIPRRLSALKMLNRKPRLVLLGDPGSGKTTFVNFVAMCLAGQALGRPEANLSLLCSPLPEGLTERRRRARDEDEKPEPQPWDHGALLPVRIVLRDFVARGLPEVGAPTVEDLWSFIGSELTTAGLGEYLPHLRKEFEELGGLLLVDGLDEVPELEEEAAANRRREQILRLVETFAGANPRARILVTSRTYAYQKRWRLANFPAAVLAPFEEPQIEQFISRWYDHVAVLRHLNPDHARGQAEDLKRAVLTNDRLLALAERPLLLTLMASLHAWRSGKLPERREELYSEAVELLLDWWESQRIIKDALGRIIYIQPSLAELLKVSTAPIRSLINRLAFEAHASQPELVGTANIMEKELVYGLSKLSEQKVDIHLLQDYISQRAGLLIPRGEGELTFPHRTFQEYLAACFLTDNEYPDRAAELACQDFYRWREVVLLAGAKAARGAASTIWLLVDALCPEGEDWQRCDRGQHFGALLAGLALQETDSLHQAAPRNRIKVERVSARLAQYLESGQFPRFESVLAGNTLAVLGDPRFDPAFWHLPKGESLGFVEIPAGPFLMGSDPQKDKFALDDEYDGTKKPHTVELPACCLARYPVTVAQFAAFVEDKKHRPDNPDCLKGVANHPVVQVTWHDARAYCEWLDGILRQSPRTPPALKARLAQGWRVTLPSEAEWEKAARGGLQMESGKNPNPDRIYPWGDAFDADKANTAETGIGTTSPVGCFPGGASPYGILDLSGNVWEWTRSLWGEDFSKPNFKYPYDPRDKRREDLAAGREVRRVLRGGSFGLDEGGARCARRRGSPPDLRYSNYGFRVVLSPF